MTMLDIVEDQKLDTTPQEPGDHDRFAHYVRKQAILQAAIDGIPATALCGKKWPPNSNPDNFGVCPMCKDIFEDNERLMGNDA